LFDLFRDLEALYACTTLIVSCHHDDDDDDDDDECSSMTSNRSAFLLPDVF